MKKSILVLALPCLIALTFNIGKVLANDGVKKHKGLYCTEAEQICYEEYFENKTKAITVQGLALFFTSFD